MFATGDYRCGSGFPSCGAVSLLAIQSEEKSMVLVGLFVATFFMSWYHGQSRSCMT